MLGVGSGSAQAALLDANCPGPTTSGSTGTQAQTFTAVNTGTLVHGEMFVAKTAGADFQMFILNAGPLGPTGPALGVANIPDSSVANVPSPAPLSPSAPIDGTFSPGVSVTAGQQYAIVVTRLGGNSSYIGKDRHNASCAGGEFSGTVGGTWTSRDPEYDFPFSTFVIPPNTFTIGKVKGTKVTMTVPGPGGVDIASAGGTKASLAAKKLVKSSHTDVTAAGDVTVRIPLTKRGKSLLRRKGKLNVKAAITYTPTGGDPNSVTSKLKLKHK